MGTLTFDITVKHENNLLWCVCKQEPGVYGYYRNEGEASVNLRNLLKLELMYKNDDVSNDNIQLNFLYE